LGNACRGLFPGETRGVHLDPLKHKDAKGTKEFTKKEKNVETRSRDEHEASRRFSYYRKYGYTFYRLKKQDPLFLVKFFPRPEVSHQYIKDELFS
jgi:hypothetical protein